jgi:hypothetical protein
MTVIALVVSEAGFQPAPSSPFLSLCKWIQTTLFHLALAEAGGNVRDPGAH